LSGSDPVQIRVLGCTGGACVDLRTTALQVNDDILVDCGSGVGDLSLEEMACIRHVFLTHSHLDHVLFLPLLSDAALALRDGPLTVYALAETLQALQSHLFNGVLWPDYTSRPTPEHPYIRLEAISLDQAVAVQGCNLTALPACHTVPAVGYLIDCGSGSFAFSGDTTYCEAFWDALQKVGNLKYVMMETTMRDQDAAIAEGSRHTTPSLLARGVRRLKSAVQLLITHIEPDKVQAVRAEVSAALGGRQVHFVQRGEVYAL
jgi:ribonuclease BN (tRNA processing enzyme)